MSMVSSIEMPTSKISTPKHVQFHAVLDNELDMLTDKETTVGANIGFTALGAALGAAPQALGSWSKLGSVSFGGPDLLSIVICAVGSAIGVYGLTFHLLNRRKNKDLKGVIRERGNRSDQSVIEVSGRMVMPALN